MEYKKCAQCSKMAVEGKSRCVECLRIANENSKIRHKTRVLKGLCSHCGKNPIVKGVRCADCIVISKNANNKRDKLRALNGLCIDCGMIARKNKTRCDKCANLSNKRNKKRCDVRVSQGLCPSCGSPAIKNKVLCRNCTLKNVSKHTTGSTKNVNILESLLREQLYRCPYTGMHIDIGEDASVDHIVPRAKGGTSELDNLEWVHIGVNFLKKDKDKIEFEKWFNEFIINSVKHRFGIDLKELSDLNL